MVLEQVKLILGDEYQNWYSIVKNILNNPEFLTLLFNITILWDNMIVLYL